MSPSDATDPSPLARRVLDWNWTPSPLPDEHRKSAALTWLGRAGGELHTAGTFTYLTDALERMREPAPLVAIARAAIDDEQRHAEICRRVASIYAGRDLPMPPLHPVPIPALREAPEALRPSLHVIGQCCINETTAGAFLQRCLDGTTEAPVREVLLALLGDEIQHARLGWAHLARIASDRVTREALSTWIPTLLELNLTRWRGEYVELPGDSLWSHGCPSVTEIDAAVLDGMRSVIVPGFAEAGLDVARATEWVAGLAPRN